MNSKHLTNFTIGVALGLLLLGCKGSQQESSSQSQESATTEKQLSRAPDFTLNDQDGKRVSLSDYQGKIVVLEWLNPECPFVVRHYQSKTMVNLANKYKDDGVVWLAVNTTNSFDQAKNKQFHSKHQLLYQVLDDRLGEVGHAYKAKTTPHMFIIDRDGQIVYNGGIDDDPSGTKGSAAQNYVAAALDELTSGREVSITESKPYGCSVKFAAK